MVKAPAPFSSLFVGVIVHCSLVKTIPGQWYATLLRSIFILITTGMGVRIEVMAGILERFNSPTKKKITELPTLSSVACYANTFFFCLIKVDATSLRLEIRLHAHQVGTNTPSGTETIVTLI